MDAASGRRATTARTMRTASQGPGKSPNCGEPHSSGVLLTASLVAAWAYPLWPVVLGLKVLRWRLAWTSVPSSLKRLAEGRVGVGTIAALGARSHLAIGGSLRRRFVLDQRSLRTRDGASSRTCAPCCRWCRISFTVLEGTGNH